jgi:hypothetical protein
MMGLSAFRRISEVFGRLAVRQRGGGQPTNRRQDKSRSLFAGRSAADGRKIKDLAQCAFLSRNVRILRNDAKSKLLAHRIETADRRRRRPR